jgi:hypothetical protein
MLIAESGSTKTDWVLVDADNNIQLFKSIGFNPFFHSSDFIRDEISKKQRIFSNC